MFSEYISLGKNCECAFQIRRILGRDSSSFFSWNVTPLPAVDSLIRNRFQGILQLQNITPHADGSLLNDASHGFKFHSPFNGFRDDPAFEKKFQDYKSKQRYLIDKFFRAREPGERTAYFYKADAEPEDREDIRDRVRAVRDTLVQARGDSAFALVIIQDKQFQEPAWDDALIFNRYLARLAPWYDATDGHVASWDRIFAEFPHSEPMRFAGF